MTVRQISSFLIGMALLASPAYSADRLTADAFLAGVPDLLKNADYKTIEEFCARSLQADDTCPSAHYFLGLCLEKNKKTREAVKEYQLAATIAAKEKDTALASKASAAAKRLGAGILEIDALDARFAEKLDKLASDAFNAGRLETARKTYSVLVLLQPENKSAKENLERAVKAIEEQGDPIKSKIAAAMLSEVWFKLGAGRKEDAKAQAQSLASKYPDTEMGKEAAGLVARDFAAPKQEEVATLALSFKKVMETKPVTANPVSSKPVVGASSSVLRVDVGALQKEAESWAEKLDKNALAGEFQTSVKKGKEFFSKATPGAEGNQENIARALEQFIKAETLHARIQNENLSNAELAAQSQESGMLHYACLKMTLLSR